ncbi:MAG: DUF4369 domain-containing protein [Bacteroidales bacterium]
MKNKMRAKLIIIATLVLMVSSCSQNSGKFELKGKLKGISDGRAILTQYIDDKTELSDTVLINNGEFTFTGDIPEPTMCYIAIEGKDDSQTGFYAENAKMTLTGDVDSLYKAVITGCPVNDDNIKYMSEMMSFMKLQRNNLGIDSLFKTYQTTKDMSIKKNIENLTAVLREDLDKFTFNYIKQNPASYYSAILIQQNTSGRSAESIEEYLKLLDPKFYDTKIVAGIREFLENLKVTAVNSDIFTNNAPEIIFSVDKNYSGKDHKNVIYLSVTPNDDVCAITKEGIILVINPAGKKVAEFKSNLTSKPSVLAVDKSGNIFALGTIVEKKTVESRGRSMEVETPTGVECVVLDSKGNKVREIKLEGLVTATGIRVSENNLLVADTRGRVVNIYDTETGAKKSSIENLRTCCGILDFSVRNNNEVLIANLGAFRVNGFDYAGNATITFGERGSDINKFHGCCNPVSVAFLSNGGIVTVEKDPTRIKVYSKEGAKKIEGIEELVKGCTYIPMTVDSKDNVYLASKTDGIVKCSPAK